MLYLNKIFKIFFYNCGIILIFIIILELFLGSWFNDKFQNLLLSERNINKIYNFDFKYHKGYSIYKRDSQGFRIKNNVNYNNIDVLFLGGSTINQKFLNYDETIVGILNEKFFKEKNIEALNAGIDGMSINGHINSFKYWFNKIENFKPKYFVYVLGINDRYLVGKYSFRDHVDKLEESTFAGNLREYLESNSFLYNVSLFFL